jgi:hypothetical protein
MMGHWDLGAMGNGNEASLLLVWKGKAEKGRETLSGRRIFWVKVEMKQMHTTLLC